MTIACEPGQKGLCQSFGLSRYCLLIGWSVGCKIGNVGFGTRLNAGFAICDVCSPLSF